MFPIIMNLKEKILMKKNILNWLSELENQLSKTLWITKEQLQKEVLILEKIQDTLSNKYIEKYTDWLSLKQDGSYEIIFDWWKLFKLDNLWWNIDWLDENWKPLNKQEKIQQIIDTIHQYTNWLVIFANFKKPANKILKIDGNYPILARHQLEKILKDPTLTTKWWDIGFYDTIFITNAQRLANYLNKPITLTWAVADCAAITTYNKKNWSISITHAWRQWIVNGVLESLIETHKDNWFLKDIQFNLSPLAGINYEWEISKLYQNYKNIIPELEKKLDDLRTDYYYNCITYWFRSRVIECKKIIKNKINSLEKELSFLKFLERLNEIYQIDLLKEKILVPYKKAPKKWDFYLDRLIKNILLKLWVPEENIHFTKDNDWKIVYTTDLNNKWQSYRIHSLWKDSKIPPNWTVKAKNWIVYDARNIATITVYPTKK